MRLAILSLTAFIASCSGAGSDGSGPLQHPFDAFVDIDGVSLQYRDWGGNGQLMVLVPSLGMTAHSFETLAPHFSDEYRVLGITRRWHGASAQAGLGFDLDSLANDLAGFIDRVSDQPAIVVGWGWAVLEQASLARNRSDLVAGLIFLNGVRAPLAMPTDVRPPPGQFPPDTIFPSLEVAVERWLPYIKVDRAVLSELLSAAFVENEVGMYVSGPPFGTSAWGRFLEIGDWSARAYEGIETPVLAIQVRQGEYLAADLEARGFPPDSIAAAKRWATEFDDVRRARGEELLLSVVPTADVVILDEVGHNFVLESPELVAATIEDFLSRVRGRDGRAP